MTTNSDERAQAMRKCTSILTEQRDRDVAQPIPSTYESDTSGTVDLHVSDT